MAMKVKFEILNTLRYIYSDLSHLFSCDSFTFLKVIWTNMELSGGKTLMMISTDSNFKKKYSS